MATQAQINAALAKLSPAQMKKLREKASGAASIAKIDAFNASTPNNKTTNTQVNNGTLPASQTETSPNPGGIKHDMTWTDAQGRNVTQTAYDAQKRAGNDMTGWEKLDAPVAKTYNNVSSPSGAIDDFSNMDRPNELKDRNDPYAFKGETAEGNKAYQKVNGASGLDTEKAVDETVYGYKGFRAIGENEDPKDYENAKLRNELSSVTNRAINEVKNQKMEIGTFKDVIQQNAEMWKNKTKLNAEALLQQKAANDTAWEAVQGQFDENQKNAKANLDKLEQDFIKMQAERDNLQRSYYNDVNKVLGNNKGGESAGLASQMSGKGLSAGMIANATAGVDKKYQEKFANAKDNHLNALGELQDGYVKFYDSLNTNKAALGADAQDFVEKTFARSETFNQDFKDLKDTETEGMYGPIEKRFTNVTEAQIDQAGKNASKNEKAALYESASPELRRNILLDNIVKISSDFDMTQFDTNLLESAAAEPSFSKAIMIIAQGGQAAAASGEASGIGSYINQNGLENTIRTIAGTIANDTDAKSSNDIKTVDSTELGGIGKIPGVGLDLNNLPEGERPLTPAEQGARALTAEDKGRFFSELESAKPNRSQLAQAGVRINVDMNPASFSSLWNNNTSLVKGTNGAAIKYHYVSGLANDMNSQIKDIQKAIDAGNIDPVAAAPRMQELRDDVNKLVNLKKIAGSQYMQLKQAEFEKNLLR